MGGWIGNAYTTDIGWNHLEELVDIDHRMAGSDGERSGAEKTASRFRELGLDEVALEPFDLVNWQRQDSAIIEDSSHRECIALPRSPSGSVTAEFVDLGHGLPQDFDTTDVASKVVMVSSDVPAYFDRYIHRREKYLRAVEEGAAAFVYKNHVQGCLPPTGGVHSRDPIGKIPALGVSKEVGERLSRRIDGGETTVEVNAEISDGTSQNVHAKLGPDDGEEILVTSHVDAHDIAEGAMDNGVGTAMVVQLASLLTDVRSDLDARFHFVVFGAEEVGTVGSRSYAERADADAIGAVINLDGICRGRTLKLSSNRFSRFEEVGESVGETLHQKIETVPGMSPHSDHWPFVRRGIPGAWFQSKTDGQGRGWGHTYADTLDKLDRRDFVEQSIFLTEYLQRISRSVDEIQPRTEERVVELLKDEGLYEKCKLIGKIQ
jgi:Zn-dependent M28 family amino/carboxypeptidase